MQSDSTQTKTTSAGSVYRGALIVRNIGDEVATVRIYQADYSFTADGRNDFGEPGKMPRSNASWLRLNQEQVSVGVGVRSTVEYEVRVPDDATLSGTYWSVIMVEELHDAVSRGGKPQVRQTVRYAVQIITEIGATAKSELVFSNARLATENERRWFSVDMANTGDRWLWTDLWLELHDARGRLIGRFDGVKLRTFPSTSVRNRIDLSGVLPGKYQALLVADGGRNDLFGTQLELDIR